MARSSMTRRQFLQRFGAVGGSSMLFGAMNALDLMGQPIAARPEWSGNPRNARVLVLGAGLSGLAVGYELGKLGYDYTILEARDRVGGVNHTVRGGTRGVEMDGQSQVCAFDEGHYLNAGPWRIPLTHQPVLDYCRELKVPLEIFVNENDASYLYYEGEQFGPLSGRRVRLREVKADMRGYSSELLAKAVSQQALDLPLSQEDLERFVNYLVGEGYLDSADRVYRGSAARGEGSPYELTALLQSGYASRVRSIDNGIGRAPMFQPVGGMDQIPRAFHKAIGDRIQLNAEVLTIRQTEDEVRVAFRDTRTGDESEVTADYLVSCIPLSVLRTMDVPLRPELAQAVNDVRYSNSAKIGIQTKRRFWEEDDGIYGGPAYTNLPLGQFSYPSYGYLAEKGVILGFYGNADVGGLNDLPIQQRIEHVVANASKFHPQMREEFDNGYAAFWSKIQYSNGAYASNPGVLLEELQKPDGRIYLGCAAVGTSPAWMQGAFGAAWDAVDRLHSRVMA